MLGQAHVDQLAQLSKHRQEVIENGQPVDFFYALVSHRLGITPAQTFTLFAGVDVYERHFLVNDQELAAFENELGCAE